MKTAIQLAQKINKDLGRNYLSELQEINLHGLFKPIYRMANNIETLNAIVVFIIFSYDNDSGWLNLNQDRYENKKRILSAIESNPDSIFDLILKNEHDPVNEVIVEYLIEQTTWKWKTIMTLLDYHSSMIRFVSKKTDSEKSMDVMQDGNKTTLTEDYDIDKVTKVNKQKGELLEQAIAAREKADVLLGEIKKDFVQVEHAVQSDLNFSITDEKKIDPMSWRDFIVHTYPKLKLKST